MGGQAGFLFSRAFCPLELDVVSSKGRLRHRSQMEVQVPTSKPVAPEAYLTRFGLMCTKRHCRGHGLSRDLCMRTTMLLSNYPCTPSLVGIMSAIVLRNLSLKCYQQAITACILYYVGWKDRVIF